MRKQRIKVRICVGTACFVQGGADLLLYGDFLDPELLGECDIEGTSCLGGCKVESPDRKAPFVEINGTLHANVTPARLVELLKEVAHA
jgi:NADH:ubiquinone oxidoreductase subunit E